MLSFLFQTNHIGTIGSSKNFNADICLKKLPIVMKNQDQHLQTLELKSNSNNFPIPIPTPTPSFKVE